MSRIEIAGCSVGDAVGGVLITPAEAYKPSKSLRKFGGGGSRPGVSQVPRLTPFPHGPVLPLPHGQAFAPSLPPSNLPSPPKVVPGLEPSPMKLRPPGGGTGFAKLPVEAADKSPHKIAGLPPQALPPRLHGGWEALVRPTPMPGTPKVPTAAPTIPSPAYGLEMKRPGKAFRHVLKKLRERRTQPPDAAGSAKTGKTADKSATQKKPAPLPEPVRLGGHRIGELLPPVGTFKSQEVLAVNLTSAELAKARAGGFSVAGETALPGLGVTLTHLVPPLSLNAVSARELLFELVPDGGFVLNRVYAPYRLGAGRKDGGGSAPVEQAGSGCPSDRCFGGTLIKWRPELAACARDLKIGIIDTGFDKAHPALSGIRYEHKEFLPEGSARASAQHGTGVLALLAGNKDSGTPGLIPEAAFVIASAFFDDADGQPMSDTAQMVRALDWLKRSGVKVVNLSFAGPEDDLVHHAVRELARSGAAVVAAAGNDGPGAPPSYPAAYAEVVAVTAVDRRLAAYRYAGRGAHIDFAAPGVDIWTAIPGRREGPQTGTSFAVPYVTAVVAVGLSESELVPASDALAPKRRVLAKLQGSVLNLGGHGRDATFGEGLVQAPATCKAPAPVVTASLEAAASEPWAGSVKRALETAAAETTATAGGWAATVRPVSAGGARAVRGSTMDPD